MVTIVPHSFSHLLLKENGKKLKLKYRIRAKKEEASEKAITKNNKQSPVSALKLQPKFLAQSAIAVSALGFIDAGYSGDWSRIGVISQESENSLKIAAFVVVPLCLFLIVRLSKEPNVQD